MMHRALDPRQLLRNAASGPVRYGSAALLGMVVTPFALHVLGAEAFGVWALAGAVLSTLQLLDLGLTRAITRAVAAAIGDEDPTEAARVLASGRAALVVLAVAGSGLVWSGRHWLASDLFHVPAPLLPEASYVIAGTALVAAIQLVLAPYQAALEGVGRMDLSNAIDTGQRIASSLGVVVVLALGWGLAGLVWKNLLTATLTGVGYRWALRRHALAVAQQPITWNSVRVRKLLGFGRHVQVANAGGTLIEPVTKTVLARVGDMSTVALFELAWRVVASLSAATMAAATALFPAAATARAAERGRTGQDSLVDSLYHQAAGLVAWFTVPIYATVVALASTFAVVWLGQNYAAVGEAIAILAIGWLVALLSLPAFLVAQAAGHERMSTIASLVTAASAVGGVLVLAPEYGVRGAAGGIAFGLVAGAVAIQVLFARSAGSWQLLVPFSPATLTTGLLAAFAAWCVQRPLIDGWPTLALAGLVAAAVFAAGLAVAGPCGPKGGRWPPRSPTSRHEASPSCE